MKYRIVPSPGREVQKKLKGKWRTVYYCKDQAAAEACIVRCMEQNKRWMAMSVDERRLVILRAEN